MGQACGFLSYIIGNYIDGTYILGISISRDREFLSRKSRIFENLGIFNLGERGSESPGGDL